MTTIEITNNSALARGFVHLAKILPFARVTDTPATKQKMTFEEASAECNAMSLEEFGAELHRRVKEYYREDAKG